MRIIVIGGAGTIGKVVVAALSDRHELVVAGRRSGTVPVDIQSPNSVRDLYRKVRVRGCAFVDVVRWRCSVSPANDTSGARSAQCGVAASRATG